MGCEIPRIPEERRRCIGRNTALLKEIVDVFDAELDDPEHALDQLEGHFHDRLLVNVGNIATVSAHAEQLRLNITEDECATVLDYIAEQKMVVITVNHVENAINERFGWDRFIEP